jgi:acetyl esterase/lipase
MLRNLLLLATLASSLCLASGCQPQPTGKHRTPLAKKEMKSEPLAKPAKAAPPPPIANKAEGPQVPADVQYVPDLTYCTIGTTRLLLDVAYPKKGTGPFPAVVLLHGGGWCLGGRKSNVPLALKLAHEGYVAVPVSHRLSGEAPFPAAIHDVKCAVRWLRAHAQTYPIDPERIAALGYSAGGHLACLLGATGGLARFEGDGGHRDQSSRVQAVVSYYGLTDLASLHDGCLRSDLPAFERTLMKFALEKFLVGSPAALDLRAGLWCGTTAKPVGRYVQASPLTHATKDAPPTLLLHGTADRLVPCEQSRQYAQKLREVGAKVELLELKDAPHDFSGKPEEQVNAAMLAFLAQHLKERPGPAAAR